MSQFLNISHLEIATNKFFEMHWNAAEICVQPPKWIGWHNFEGSVPNYQYGGCYALFENENLVYIGVGASKGGGLYPEHGISRRLMSHVIKSDRIKGAAWSQPRNGWENITSIYTIGFPGNLTYLSLSLENYLIREFTGRLRNSRV